MIKDSLLVVVVVVVALVGGLGLVVRIQVPAQAQKQRCSRGVVPQTPGREVCWVGWAFKKMRRGMGALSAFWAAVVVDCGLETVHIGIKIWAISGPELG